MRAFRCAHLATWLLVSAWGGGLGRAVRAQDPDSAPPIGSRVRVISSALGPGWRAGMLNQLRLEPTCHRILIFTPTGALRVAADLPPSEIARMQVSIQADGTARPDHPRARGGPGQGELWREVPLGALKDCPQGPPLPRHLLDYCEGESCSFGYRVAVCERLALRSGDTDSRSVTGELYAGDSAIVVTGNLRVRRPGLVVLRRDTILATDDGEPREDTLRLRQGDTVFVLEYRELGHWTWWHGGRLGGGMEFWNGPAQAYFGPGRDSLAGRSLSAPEAESWLWLRSDRGQEGWWMQAPGVVVRPAEGERCGAS